MLSCWQHDRDSEEEPMVHNQKISGYIWTSFANTYFCLDCNDIIHSICSWRHRKNNENGEKACPTLLCPIATACGIFIGAVATQCRDLKNNLCQYSTSAFSSANFPAISLWLCVQRSAICRTPTRCQTKPWTRETGYVSLECRLPVRVWKLQLIWTAPTHTHTHLLYIDIIYIYIWAWFRFTVLCMNCKGLGSRNESVSVWSAS